MSRTNTITFQNEKCQLDAMFNKILMNPLPLLANNYNINNTATNYIYNYSILNEDEKKDPNNLRNLTEAQKSIKCSIFSNDNTDNYVNQTLNIDYGEGGTVEYKTTNNGNAGYLKCLNNKKLMPVKLNIEKYEYKNNTTKNGITFNDNDISYKLKICPIGGWCDIPSNNKYEQLSYTIAAHKLGDLSTETINKINESIDSLKSSTDSLLPQVIDPSTISDKEIINRMNDFNSCSMYAIDENGYLKPKLNNGFNEKSGRCESIAPLYLKDSNNTDIYVDNLCLDVCSSLTDKDELYNKLNCAPIQITELDIKTTEPTV